MATLTNKEPDKGWLDLCEMAGRGLVALGTFIVLLAAALRSGEHDPASTGLWLGAMVFGTGAVMVCVGVIGRHRRPPPRQSLQPDGVLELRERDADRY